MLGRICMLITCVASRVICAPDFRLLKVDYCRFAEFGASSAILKAGYTLDSLMMRYQTIDWRDKEAAKCNAQMDPTRSRTYDGTTLNPMEVHPFCPWMVGTWWAAELLHPTHVRRQVIASRLHLGRRGAPSSFSALFYRPLSIPARASRLVPLVQA